MPQYASNLDQAGSVTLRDVIWLGQTYEFYKENDMISFEDAYKQVPGMNLSVTRIIPNITPPTNEQSLLDANANRINETDIAYLAKHALNQSKYPLSPEDHSIKIINKMGPPYTKNIDYIRSINMAEKIVNSLFIIQQDISSITFDISVNDFGDDIISRLLPTKIIVFNSKFLQGDNNKVLLNNESICYLQFSIIYYLAFLRIFKILLSSFGKIEEKTISVLVRG